jgi:hypothetical protein
MSRRPNVDNGMVGSIHIISHNVNHSYEHVETLLQTVGVADILFIQEPPRRLIRHTFSASSDEGEAVMGAPLHPDWSLFENPPSDTVPRVSTYMHKHLLKLQPALRRDVLSREDLFLLNVYNDTHNCAIKCLSEAADLLLSFHLAVGDFNCHSDVWDPRVTHHHTTMQSLIDCMSDIGLFWLWPENPGNTHIPHDRQLNGSVIDLVFSHLDEAAPRLLHQFQGGSDHVPVGFSLSCPDSNICVTRMVLPKLGDKEHDFVTEACHLVAQIPTLLLDSPEGIKQAARGLSLAFSTVWSHHAVEQVVTARSKTWWSKDCSIAKLAWHKECSSESHAHFRQTTRAAKHSFFEDHIKDVAVKCGRPWDLMD